MVAFATAATITTTDNSPGVLPTAITHASRTLLGSVHEDCGTPNQDTFVSHVSPSATVFLVLDGHGQDGGTMATNVASTLLRHTLDRLQKLAAEPIAKRHYAALDAAFFDTAKWVEHQPDAEDSGTTASVIILERDVLTVANVGDSDVVHCSNGVTKLVSFRHRPAEEEEKQRVLKYGSIVTNDYLCDGSIPAINVISVTRALGDLSLKYIGVIPIPQIATYTMAVDDFIILATDGLWDAHGGTSYETAANAVQECFKAGGDVSDAVNELALVAKGNHSLPFDDFTVTVVRRASQSAATYASSSS